MPVRVGSSEGLGVNSAQRARRDVIQDPKQIGHKLLKMLNTVALGYEYYDGDRENTQILLKLKVSISCYEDLERGGSQCQELAILEARPACGPDRYDFMAGDELRQVLRQRLVKQYAHLARALLWPAQARRLLPHD